jgi:hypothetical protein
MNNALFIGVIQLLVVAIIFNEAINLGRACDFLALK